MEEPITGLLLATTIWFSLTLLVLPLPVATRVKQGEQTHAVIDQLRLSRSTPLGRLQTRLDRTHSGITAAHYLVISIFAGAVAYFVCAFVLRSWWLASPACLAGFLFAERLVAVLSIRQKERFEAGNIKAVRVMANALRTSPSYLHAFEQAAQSPFVDEKVSKEYRHAVEMLQGQLPLTTVMSHFRNRTGSMDIGYLATIVQVQRELGGDMGKTLELAARAILRRKQMQRRQRAAMSQLLAQVNLLSIMPFVFVMALFINNPHHFDPLTSTLQGRMLMLGAFLAILVGGEIIRHVAVGSNR